eukprot:CAMPEP_0172559412 /NCGR_PEP_ID=MMETSP1067-20121228/83834_1 /TAXON_ID=265564 ORGANISM="Thalassiosira punctigera, Strain Tpunct2005C2" /NCGR_SAMPLE_ID=MMETSP1067 /ASSEMBLY_ACC=CAM_ASM_000444 /LENGTH=55 /DNA_ID=CAMNT_0013348995 /DNA_START=368 /DNA_END=535 /DNA_ORIENTATION=+
MGVEAIHLWRSGKPQGRFPRLFSVGADFVLGGALPPPAAGGRRGLPKAEGAKGAD